MAILNISQDSKKGSRNPWVIALVSGVVLVVLVNVAFITTAVLTNPGLVENDYYEKGRDHERHFLSRQETMNRLGWQMGIAPVDKPVIGQPIRLTFNVVDPAGIPVRGESVMLHAYRPSDASADFSLPMQEVTAGVYSAEAVFPLKGIWDLKAAITKGDDQLNVTRRISVEQ